MNFYLLLISSFFLFACEAFYRSPHAIYPPAGYPPPTGYPPGQTSPFNPTGSDPNDTTSLNSPSEWGIVKCNSDQYDHFNKQLTKFLSTSSINIKNLHVDCRGQENTKGGLFLKGSVNFIDDGVFDPSSSQTLKVAADSHLEIHIVEITGAARRIVMKALPYGEVISGPNIVLAFKDDKGKVFLNGVVQNGIFSGVFSYENSYHLFGGEGFKGEIGYFSIYACSLLKCQESAPDSGE